MFHMPSLPVRANEMDDYTLSLLVLMANAERVVALRGVDRAYRPLLIGRIERYRAQIDGELAHLRSLRLDCLGQLQYADEHAMSPREPAVREARRRLRFAERMLLRLVAYRRDLDERLAELRHEERHRLA
jgi:hypothetical protein